MNLLKYKYIILGNIAGGLMFASIALSGYNWILSIICGILSAVVANYIFFDVKKKVMENLEVIINSIGGYIGVKFENGKIIKISGEVKGKDDIFNKLDEVLK